MNDGTTYSRDGGLRVSPTGPETRSSSARVAPRPPDLSSEGIVYVLGDSFEGSGEFGLGGWGPFRERECRGSPDGSEILGRQL